MNKTYTLLSLFTLFFGLFALPAKFHAQITNGQVNYELRVDQWYQSCDNDWINADDNEIRIGLSSDGNTGGTASWTSGGNGASCGGNLYVRRWQADAPSTVTNSNTLLYYCTNRNNINDNFSIYYNSWEEDGSPDCDPGGDACQSNGTYTYTFKSASKTPSLWWGYTGTAGGSFMTGNSGDFFAKTVWRYTYGDGCGSALNFGTLSSGTTYSHVNSNRPSPGGASGNMGYTSVSGNSSQDVFYQFSISSPASVVISTNNAGTDYDTYLRLYNSTSCGTQIAFNDDYGGSVNSTINMDLCAGTYVIQVEGFSTSFGNFNLSVQATNRPVNGGTIAGITNGVNICPGDDPGAFTSSVDATGAGGVTYQWESSTTGAGSGYSNIVGQTANTYDPGALTQTTWFRRRATDGCGQVGYSNVIQVVMNTASTAPTAISGTTTICAGNSTTLTLSGGSAGTGATAQWFSGSCGGTLVGTGNSITVSPTSNTTYFVRYSGTCNTTTCASVNVTVNTLSVAPTGITGTTTI
ncbi:MAG: immunoglobulin domain-containing protein, partial [Flavobacteriales bacterium]